MKGPHRFLLGGITCATVVVTSFGVAGASTPSAVAEGSFVGSIPTAGLSFAQRSALAAVTPAQADATAVATVTGTAGTPELISDYGFLVYRTIVTGADGTRTEVIIDAGDGTVLDHYAPYWNGVIGVGDNDVFGKPAAVTTSAASAPTGSFVGSVVWNGSTGAALRAMATVTAAQANAAAVAAVPGTAGTPEVIFDRGFVVYRTIVTATDGTKTEVIVDAGNATVLDQYAPQWDGTIGTSTTTVVTAPFVGSISKAGKTTAEIAALVTVSPSQANDAAVAEVPGTPGPPELIHDYGFVVYRTVVTAADGTRTEVIVDAGTGAVLDHYAPVWNGIPGSDGV